MLAALKSEFIGIVTSFTMHPSAARMKRFPPSHPIDEFPLETTLLSKMLMRYLRSEEDAQAVRLRACCSQIHENSTVLLPHS